MKDNILKELQNIIQDKELDAILITDLYRILYLINSEVSLNIIEADFFLLITQETIYLIGDPFSFNLIDVPENVIAEKTSIADIKDEGFPTLKKLKKLLNKLNIRKIGSFEDIKLDGKKIVNISDPFRNHFIIPDKNRKQQIIENSKICKQVMDELSGEIKEGISEIELRNWIDSSIYRMGGERRAFPTKVIFGGNTANPFAISNASKLKDGDSIIVHFGLIRSGVGVETSRSLIFGESPGEKMKNYRKVNSIYRKLQQFIKPGKIIREINYFITDLIEERNLREHHVPPLSAPLSPMRTGIMITPENDSILKPGSLLSLHLNFSFPGDHGIKVQDLIYVGDRIENLTGTEDLEGKSAISYKI